MVANPHHPLFEQLSSRRKEKSFSEASTGMILEVAQHQCGGPDGLASALAGGRITKTANQNGIDFYHFPTVEVRKAETVVEDSTRCVRVV